MDKPFYCAQVLRDNYVYIGKEKTLYSGWTGFQEVEIFLSSVFGKVLLLDQDIQSSQMDECVYHETFVHSPMLLVEPKSVLIVGGGEGAVLREVVKYRNIQRIVMVDLDEMLVNLCQEFLSEWSCGSFLDPRVQLIFADIRDFCSRSDERFDLILMDCPSPQAEDSALNALYTREMFESLKQRLNQGGVFATQSHSYFSPLCRDVYTILRDMYTYVYQVCCYVPSFFDLWSFTIGSDLRVLPSFEDGLIRLKDIRMKFHIPHSIYTGYLSPYLGLVKLMNCES